MKSLVKNLIRALRLPFVSASALPFIFGSLVSRTHFNMMIFLLGLTTVISTHLSANLINDFADSESGVDWQDKRVYNFFGGSKLIQEGTFSKEFYLGLAISFALISFFSALALTVALKNIFILGIFMTIISASWAYSVRPLQFSYRGLGEVTVFILFGPALVMGGYFLQTNIFPDLKSFMLSLPFGFLTTAILYANEIPDLKDDKASGKFTLAGAIGRKDAYLFYYSLTALAFLSIILNVNYRFIGPRALFSLLLIFVVCKAARILEKHVDDKDMLVESSRLTIAVQTLASLILITAVIL